MSGSQGVLKFGDEQMMNGGGGAGPEAGMLGEDVEGPLFAGPIYSNRPSGPRPAPNRQLYPSLEPMTHVPAVQPLSNFVQVMRLSGGNMAASTLARCAPETVEEPKAIRISVTAPLKETGPSLIPGVNEPYYTYLVNTSTTLSAFSQPEMSVRRRFRDFVDLAKLLKLNFRGYFIPQRPHRNVYQGKIRMSPSFIEERRSNLEKYLRQLAVHPIISRSEELRAFLEARGQLRECLGWLQLHPMEPSWLEGATLLMRQLVGLERMVPTPTEVSQQPSVKRHMVRAVREKFKRIKDKRQPAMDFTAQETQLRQEAEVLEEFQKAVDFAWKWASCWMSRYEAMGQSFDRFGSALTAMSNFELDSGYMKIPGAAAVGKGCTDASALHLQYTNQTAKALAHIKEYQEQMKNVLGALSSREKALTTLQTLDIDVKEKKLKLEQLQVTPGMSRKVQAAEQDIRALEVSKAAAQSSYEKLANLNAEELTRFREARRMDWSDMLRGYATTQAAFSTQSMELWCRVAEGLGADAKILQAIKNM